MSESMSLSEARSRAAAILEREGIALTEQERAALSRLRTSASATWSRPGWRS